MAKDPAFLFYPNDYLGGTMGMTFEEKGAYMELLMLQFNRGHMTSHMIGHTIGQLWDNIQVKFKIDTQGLYYNERLDLEIEKRQKYTESRKNNKSGRNQHTEEVGHTTSHMTSHMTGHMENENELSTSVELDLSLKEQEQPIKTEQEARSRRVRPTLDEVKEYCQERKNDVDPEQWFDFYTAKDWYIGKNRMKDWRAAVRTWEKSRASPGGSGRATKSPMDVLQTIYEKELANEQNGNG